MNQGQMLKRLARAFVTTVFLAGLAGPCVISAQANIDPSDGLYQALDAWSDRGVLRNLPLLRPYSADLIAALLDEVAARGSSRDAREAGLLRDGLSKLQGSLGLNSVNEWRDSTYISRHGLGAGFFAMLGQSAAAAARVGLWMAEGDQGAALPPGERPAVDLGEDTAFPLTLGGLSYAYRLETVSAISAGTGSASVQAGVTRASFGPFFSDGVVIGPQAPVSGNLIFNWRGEWLSFTEGFFAMNDRLGDGSLLGGKFLVVHGIQVAPPEPFSWLEVAFFESVVWNQRFMPIYLIPAADLFYAQSLDGFRDNSFVGASVLVRPIPGVSGKGSVYFDDMFKFAAQAGVSWKPDSLLVRSVALDYTAVMPYTYTHPAADRDNYTNWGANIGPQLDPDSDRLQLTAEILPSPGVRIGFLGRLIRHGNPSEGVTGGGDGSLTDTGYAPGVVLFPTNISEFIAGGFNLHLLTQSVIDTSLQLGISAVWDFTSDWGNLSVSGSYLFETRWNEGLVPGTVQFHNYFSINFGYAL
jgi:hypothetical protein